MKDKEAALDIYKKLHLGMVKYPYIERRRKFKPDNKILVNTAINYIRKESKVIYIDDENPIISSENIVSKSNIIRGKS
ncbi:MAG: hypothetical protein ACLRPW_08825 [Intestinibacter sp.]